MLDRVVNALWEPLRYPLRADQRLFWGFLVGAFVLAFVARSRQGPRGWARELRALFSARVWLHPSSLLDWQLLFAKPVIRALLFAPWMLSSYALSLSIVGALDEWRGVPERSSLSPTTIRILYTAVLFASWDFSRFLIHKLAHTVPFLWELHKVHHSAEVMTPLTIYRSHPLESLLFQLRGIVVTGVVTGLFFHLFRVQAQQYELLGVNAAGFVLNVVGGNLRHSHVWLRYPRWLEHLFISPAQHQIHHSSVMERCHSNYGSWLAVWDWLFGSLRTSDSGRPFRFGLPRHELNHSPRHLGSALLGPLRAALFPRRRAYELNHSAVDKSAPHGLHV